MTKATLVEATAEARALLDEIRAEAGEVLFHVSGGCCDGTQPMCYPAGEFRLGAGDVKLGEVAGAGIWVSGAQAPIWAGQLLTLDAGPGRGGVFSLDNGRGRRFIARSTACSL
ncbi:DUF779 domain-containing protein [Frigidibacter sp. MR17.14]|uniref:DUF779 domain-containing protein n=1 Tax=Frigidibacter sp. MR17.14 TaxID=3126509 RepID=UPI00301303E8